MLASSHSPLAVKHDDALTTKMGLFSAILMSASYSTVRVFFRACLGYLLIPVVFLLHGKSSQPVHLQYVYVSFEGRILKC